MFATTHPTAALADDHRRALLADAEAHRLARIAAGARPAAAPRRRGWALRWFRSAPVAGRV